MANIKKKRLKEWHKDPHCRYCGRETILEHGNISAANMATIDHVNSRLDMRKRLTPAKGEERRILVCYQCNQYKNDLEVADVPIEELRERSKRHPSRVKF